MAEVNRSTVSPCDVSTHYFNSQIVRNCANWVLKDQQLQLAFMEMKSARTIISVLQEDLKYRLASFTQQISYEPKARGNSQGNQKWETVSHNNTRNKKLCNPEVKKRHHSVSYDTTNRYALLSSSSSSSICHGVGPLVDPFRSHVSRSLFKGLPWFLLPVGE
jgi:hypothetical protein